MAITETFLELAPEFGGTRFGPFSGMEVRLGSDPARNDIVLPENLGVLPEHLKLLNQGDSGFIVAPVDRTAGVFVFRAGSGAKQVTSPIAVQGAADTYSADSFSVVTPEGPRFYVLTVAKREDAKEKESALGKAKKRLSGRSLFSEIKRQGMVMFLTQKGGAQFQRWLTFVKTGAILRPRNLITGAAVVAGWIFAGGLSMVACQAAVGGATAKEKLDDCEVARAIAGAGGDEGVTLETHVARVLGNGKASENWKQVLRADQEFNGVFRKQLAGLINNERTKDSLRWVYRRQSSGFTQVRTQMKKNGWPDELIRTAAYISAVEGAASTRDWTFLESDSLGEEVCARGPMIMTWRQAMQLKVPGVSYTAAMSMNDYGAAGDPEKIAALQESASRLRNHVPPEAEQFGTLQRAQPVNDNTATCIYADEDISTDPRDPENLPALIKALGSSIGPNASNLPSMDSTNGGLNRLVRYYAADYNGDYNKLDLSSGSALTSSMLNDVKKVKDYAMERAAATLAKAVVIPCLARFDPNFEDLDLDKVLGGQPEPMDCLIVFGIIEYNL